MQTHLEQFVKEELPRHLQKFQATTTDTLNQIQVQQAQVQQLLEKFAEVMAQIQDESKLPDFGQINARIQTLQKRVDKICASSKAQLAKAQDTKQLVQQEAGKSRQVVEKDIEQLNQVFGSIFF